MFVRVNWWQVIIGSGDVNGLVLHGQQAPAWTYDDQMIWCMCTCVAGVNELKTL